MFQFILIAIIIFVVLYFLFGNRNKYTDEELRLKKEGKSCDNCKHYFRGTGIVSLGCERYGRGSKQAYDASIRGICIYYEQ